MIEWQKTETGECEKLEDVPKGAGIISVDDVVCLGTCEGCGKPILENDDYGVGQEGVMVCSECAKD